MPHSFEMKRRQTFTIPPAPEARTEEPLSVEPLTDDNEREALAFLSAADTVQAVFMAGLIRDNGLESPFNRGIFYGARREDTGELAGISIIGHATLVETSNDSALKTFAHIAREIPGAHVLLGQEELIKRFWMHYARGGQRARLICRELLFRMRGTPSYAFDGADELRLATLDDLSFVMPVQACMAFEESGVNPMEVDPVGFRLRCARRIEQGRVFVWIEDNRLLFKADILADTQAAIYLEGVYTSPQARNQSHGSRAMARMARMLLNRARSIILLVNEQNSKAQEFYARAGFNFAGYYDTIFLQTGYEVKG